MTTRRTSADSADRSPSKRPAESAVPAGPILSQAGQASWPRLKAHLEVAGLERELLLKAAIEAAIEGHVDRARAILEASPDLARADIFAAATFGEAEAVRGFLAGDPSLARAQGGPRGWEPLLYLGLSRFLGRDAARTEGARSAALLLLEAGADPNVHTVMESPEFKQTPLYGAAGLANDPDLTRLLLEHGADPNDRTEFLGPESLYHASEHADNACLQLILAQHPEPDKVSYCLGRKLDFEDPEGVRLYLLHGADPPFGLFETRLHKALLNGRSPGIVAMLLEHGADPDLATRAGHTALALAIRLGQTEAVAILAEAGADPAIVNDHGGTALGSALHGLEHCDSIEGGMTAAGAAGLAASAGDRQEDRQEDARALRYARTIETLLEAGADPAELPAQGSGVAEVDAIILRYRS